MRHQRQDDEKGRENWREQSNKQSKDDVEEDNEEPTHDGALHGMGLKSFGSILGFIGLVMFMIESFDIILTQNVAVLVVSLSSERSCRTLDTGTMKRKQTECVTKHP